MFYIIRFFSILLIVLSFYQNILTSPISKIAVLILMYTFGGVILTFLDFYYLGLMYIIVYVGAIAIIFLFVIMMILDQPLDLLHRTGQSRSTFIYLFGLLLLGLGLGLCSIWFTEPYSEALMLNFRNNWFGLYTNFTDIHILSKILFNGYFILILIIGILLWTILIGILGLGLNSIWYLLGPLWTPMSGAHRICKTSSYSNIRDFEWGRGFDTPKDLGPRAK